MSVILLIAKSSTYKNGIIKMLRDMIEPRIPFKPNLIEGKNIAQAKMQELIGISDHVNVPEIATSTIETAKIPRRRKMEKTAAQMLCVKSIFIFTVLFTYSKALTILASTFLVSVSVISPSSN